MGYGDWDLVLTKSVTASPEKVWSLLPDPAFITDHIHPVLKEIGCFAKCLLTRLLSGYSVLGTVLDPGETGYLLHLESRNK